MKRVYLSHIILNQKMQAKNQKEYSWFVLIHLFVW